MSQKSQAPVLSVSNLAHVNKDFSQIPPIKNNKTTQWHPLFCFASRSEPSNKYTKIDGCSTVAHVLFSHENLFDFNICGIFIFLYMWLWYYRFIWGYFDGFNIFMNINNKIIKILPSIKKNKGFEWGHVGICVFLYTVKLNIFPWIQEIYFFGVRSVIVFQP